MRILWSYELPHRGADSPLDGNTPLHWDGHAVVLPTHHFIQDRDTRAQHAAKRGYRFDIHYVTANGKGKVEHFEVERATIAQTWSFLQLAGNLVLHVGSFHALPSGKPINELPFVDASDGAGRGVFLQQENLLVFAAEQRVFCHDAVQGSNPWTLELPNKHRYGAAPIFIRDGYVECYGNDALNFIDLQTGKVERQQTLPRVDRPFSPVEHEGDLLFPYTNWTSGGLIRFDSQRKKVKWQFTKRGRAAPPRGRRLIVAGQTAVITLNGGSSIVGVDLVTGKARWTIRAQWLYTPIEVCDSSIIFGTSGGYGRHLRRHDIETGETEWAVPMAGGCTYYANHADQIIAGDWGGTLRVIRRSDGEVIDQLALGVPLTGPPLVVGSCVYLLRYPTDDTPPSLVSVAADG